MTHILQELSFYLSYPFVRYALIVGVLIALCSSLLGVTLVLKRFSFIGDGLSHVAFGAMAVATIFKLVNNTIFIMPVTIIAVGYLVMNIFSTSANVSGDVCSTLFGSTTILTLTEGEVISCIIMSVLVVAFFILFYNRIFAVTFDENFTKAIGKNAEGYNLMIAVITAVIIVLAMSLVGSLLISALIIFPALSAMRVARSFKGVVVYAAILSVVGAFFGIVLSILCSTPVGATIVILDLILFFINCIIGKIMGR